MLLVALFVVLPASGALAQSAGDNQYQDPLGGGGGSSGSTQPSAPSKPAQSGGGNSAPTTPSQAPKTTRSVPLARTGFDAWIPAAAGLVLLVGGVLLLRTRQRSA
jgi:LPXTG-motif cell wall-anchored protein